MAVSDYDKTKSLEVQSVSGTPTVDKAQPIYITSGDDSQTGTGEIVLDWSGISGPEDVAVYDQNDNLLDYEIEELDTTNETGVIWVYNSWVRDGTVQAKKAYGNGPGDNQNVSGTWNNSGQNVLAAYHMESTNESSGNANSLTHSGPVKTENGQFGDAYDYDGTDDTSDTNTAIDSDTLTVVAWTEYDTTTPDSFKNVVGCDDGTNGWWLGNNDTNEWRFGLRNGSENPVVVLGNTITSGYHQLVGTYDVTTDGNATIYVDGAEGQTSTASTHNQTTANTLISDNPGFPDQEVDGTIDEVRVYSEKKSSDWIQSEYDASAKAGQTFFSQEAASGGGGQSLRSKVDTNRGREDENRSRQDSNRSRQDSDRRRID